MSALVMCKCKIKTDRIWSWLCAGQFWFWYSLAHQKMFCVWSWSCTLDLGLGLSIESAVLVLVSTLPIYVVLDIFFRLTAQIPNILFTRVKNSRVKPVLQKREDRGNTYRERKRKRSFNKITKLHAHYLLSNT